MWLTGYVTSDHNTINSFRSRRLKDVLKTIFAIIVKFLVSEGFVSLDVACTDGMYCPMGQRMERLSDARRITDNGFAQTISRYRVRNCKGNPLKCRCHRSHSERVVQVNHRLRKIKDRECEKLLSDEGLKYCSQRPQDVTVFGNLKNNKHFKRFSSSWA